MAIFFAIRQAELHDGTPFRVMRIAQDNPVCTQRERAETRGLSVSGLNCLLIRLIEKGFEKTKNFANAKHKFGFVYALTLAGIVEKAAITHRVLRRQGGDCETLKAQIEALGSKVGEYKVADLGTAKQ